MQTMAQKPTATLIQNSQSATGSPQILGAEGGGTKTEWVLARQDESGRLEEIRSGLLPAGNMKLLSDAQLLTLFAALPTEVDRVGVFLAGCATDDDRRRLFRLCTETWPGSVISAGSDRDSALAACFEHGDGIVVIAGTGAAVHGRRGTRVEKAGGWGQLLGDRGGGYHLGMQALRSVLSHYDLNLEIHAAAREILRMLGLNRLQDLVQWVSQADKMSVARLAPAVFDAAERDEPEMRAIITAGAEILAGYAHAVARRLDWETPHVALFGGLFAHHPIYREIFSRRLAALLPRAHVEAFLEGGAMGAAWLALESPTALAPRTEKLDIDTAELSAAATEQRNPRSQALDQLATPDLVDLFITEEDEVTRALRAAKTSLVQAVDLVSASLKAGGRLFYVGAGTSGRLGVLDASEIPPTFGASPELIQGIIAGGVVALHRAVEGAEDQPEGGAHAIQERGAGEGDVVCGIAASGRTPFVLGALARARALGAHTILLTCNPARRAGSERWDVEIDLPTGPELVTGSTRLKAGTATKLSLNIISTCAMVALGKVKGNSMVEVQITNCKLRDRGARLVSQELGVPYEQALALLEKAGWNVRACLEAHHPGAAP